MNSGFERLGEKGILEKSCLMRDERSNAGNGGGWPSACRMEKKADINGSVMRV